MAVSMEDIISQLEGQNTSTPSQRGVSAPASRPRNTWTHTISSPLPFGLTLPQYPSALKQSDVNKKRGIITAYLTCYFNDDGSPFIDPYNDIIAPGSFTKTIQTLDAFRKRTSNPWLCPSLWQHDRNELIGGIARLSEDSKGVIYECQLAMGVRRAQEALDLAEQKMIGSSYGYDPLDFNILPGNVRKLLQIGLKEQSFVSFPANPLATILGVKNSSYSPSALAEVRLSTLISEMRNIGTHNQNINARDTNEEAHNPSITTGYGYSREYKDYLWRQERLRSYQNNPAAFQQNSRFGG